MRKEIDCEFCGERVLAKAKKCPHCRSWLDASAKPGPKRKWSGDVLAIPRDTALPPGECCMCADSGASLKKKNFVFVPQVAYVGILAGPIGLAVATTILQQKQTLHMPLCQGCGRKWTGAQVFFISFILIGMIAFPVIGAMLGSAMSPRKGALFGVFLGIALWIVGIFAVKYLVVNNNQGIVQSIDDDFVRLKFPNPKVTRAALPNEGDQF
ncbi:MAG: hypothetical protein P1V97_09515 [Planctomycetota bacterium]|nr:hypothetical protein [Planctomycetota bacterium]